MAENIEPPVSEGQIIDSLSIFATGSKGDGLGKVDGFVIIIPGTVVNQTYKVKITKVTSTVAFGEIVND